MKSALVIRKVSVVINFLVIVKASCNLVTNVHYVFILNVPQLCDNPLILLNQFFFFDSILFRMCVLLTHPSENDWF